MAKASHNSAKIHAAARRGRAANLNMASRFDQEERESFDDGWTPDEVTPLRTTTIIDSSKTILAQNNSPDVPFDRSINPYRGCEHGCIYCYARPSHAFLGLSPGLDFESKIHIKPNAVELLDAAFRRPSYTPKTIGLGTNTDPYQPLEKTHKITRGILEYLLERRHPVGVVTKGQLINRDIDILTEMAKLNLVSVAISVTTLDNHLHRAMEPRAMAPAQRLKTIAALSEAGVPVNVLAAPMIPKVNDQELEDILKAAKDAGAGGGGYIALRLPLEVAPLFEAWLEEHFPDRAAKVMRHVREMHGGEIYRAEFGARMRGSGQYADLLETRFKLAAKKLELNQNRTKNRTDLFRKPSGDSRQLELF